MPSRFKPGDKVRIIFGPPEKIGKVGTVGIVGSNGVVIQFPDGMGTAVLDAHLELVEEDESHFGHEQGY